MARPPAGRATAGSPSGWPPAWISVAAALLPATSCCPLLPGARGPLTLGNARGSSCRKIKFLSSAPRGGSARARGAARRVAAGRLTFPRAAAPAGRACQPLGRPPGAPRARPLVFLSRLSLACWRLCLSGTRQPGAPGAAQQTLSGLRAAEQVGELSCLLLRGGREQEEEAEVGGEGRTERKRDAG